MLKGITVLNSYDIITPEWGDKIFPASVCAFIAVSGIALIIYTLLTLKPITDLFVPFL